MDVMLAKEPQLIAVEKLNLTVQVIKFIMGILLSEFISFFDNHKVKKDGSRIRNIVQDIEIINANE